MPPQLRLSPPHSQPRSRCAAPPAPIEIAPEKRTLRQALRCSQSLQALTSSKTTAFIIPNTGATEQPVPDLVGSRHIYAKSEGLSDDHTNIHQSPARYRLRRGIHGICGAQQGL